MGILLDKYTKGKLKDKGIKEDNEGNDHVNG